MQLIKSSFSFDSCLLFLRRSWPVLIVDPWLPLPSTVFLVSGDFAESLGYIKIWGSERCRVYWYVCIFRLPLYGDVLRLLRSGDMILFPIDSLTPLSNVRDWRSSS